MLKAGDSNQKRKTFLILPVQWAIVCLQNFESRIGS